MYKKHLEHFLTVSLKYLFDLDYTNVHNAYLMLLMIPFMMKLVIVGMAAYLYDGIMTVNEDFREIRTNAATYRQQWNNSELKAAICSTIRAFRDNLAENHFRMR